MFILFLLFPLFSWSITPGFYDGINLDKVHWEDIANKIQVGDVLVLGEIHNEWSVSDFQVHVMKTLRSLGHKVHVGMEFLDFTKQSLVDSFQNGTISEDHFVREAWEGGNYAIYRRQILFAQRRLGEHLFALNAPRTLTSYVARHGLEMLPDNLRILLPPLFELGNTMYFERFKNVMNHGFGEESLKRYFTAQSIWDDTMAYQSSIFANTWQDGILVIIVGEFHAAYGGGLPDRLQKRIPGIKIWTISQIPSGGVREDYLPSPEYGQRANWIYVFDSNQGD